MLSSTLIEINLFPYINYIFYIIFLLLIVKHWNNSNKLFVVFLFSLILESAFIIDIGFFVKPNHIMGGVLIWQAGKVGFKFPAIDTAFLVVLVFTSWLSIVLNYDLLGVSEINTTRGSHFRPIIQLGQMIFLIMVMISYFSMQLRDNNFYQSMLYIHLVSVLVAIYALYEVISIYFHLPFIMLNNDLSSYWYMGFRHDGVQIFRPRSTFYEPINFNNFLFFGIACSMNYYELFNNILRKRQKMIYGLTWLVLIMVLLGSFSRSTILTVICLIPISVILYPKNKISNILKLSVFIPISLVLFEMLGMYDVFFERFRNISENISLLGRAGAIAEVSYIESLGRWIFGVGLGNAPSVRGSVSSFDSMYNQIYINIGFVGLVIYFCWIASIFIRMFANVIDKNNYIVSRKINAIFIVGFLGLCVQRLSFPGFLTDTYLWVAIGTSIFIAHNLKANKTIYGYEK